jgi:predicted transposase YdaD
MRSNELLTQRPQNHDFSPELLDELLKGYENPEDLLGQGGILKQLTVALVERCLNAELKTQLEILQLIGIQESLATDRAKQLIDRTRTEVTDVATTRSILELITTVFVYKFPTLSREEIELMLGLDSLKQTRFYQEAQQEGLEIGRQQMLSRTVPVLLQAGLSLA